MKKWEIDCSSDTLYGYCYFGFCLLFGCLQLAMCPFLCQSDYDGQRF